MHIYTVNMKQENRKPLYIYIYVASVCIMCCYCYRSMWFACGSGLWWFIVAGCLVFMSMCLCCVAVRCLIPINLCG